MKKTLFLFLLVAITMCTFGAISTLAVTSGTYGDLTYKISNSEVTITDCNLSATSVEIPEIIEGNPVTSIGSGAFLEHTALISVSIPDSLTSIGKWAFQGCTGLTSISIGNGVCSIGENAFYDCTGLTSVNITDIAAWCNIEFYNYYCNPLYYAGNLYLDGNLVTDLTIPDGVTSISSDAFRGCTGLTSVTLPYGLTSIGSGAFHSCTSLAEITIPDTVIYINNYAFVSCIKLTAINIPHSVTVIGNSVFYGCTGLTSVSIGNNVTSIRDYTFYNCTGLTSVSIGNSVASIGAQAFSGCIGLTSISIGNSVTSIGARAFDGCIGLTSVSIGNGITSIGYYAFEDCKGLTSVNITDIKAWCNISFASYDSNPLYYGGSLYLNGTLVTDLIIPDGVTSIKSNAFYGCSGLTSVIIPEGVTSVGNNAFYKCNDLKSVTIPGSIKSIGYAAFLNYSYNIVGYYYGTETDWNALLSDVSIGIYTENVIFVKHTKTTVSQDGKTFSVKPVNVDSGNTVILALYNGNKLAEVQYKTYNGEELPFSTSKSYTKAKVMAWSDLSTAMPISDAEVVSGI